METRIWFCEVSVFGVPGRSSLFSRFHVGFFLGSQPAFIDLIPAGQVTALPEPAFDGMAAATLPWWSNASAAA